MGALIRNQRFFNQCRIILFLLLWLLLAAFKSDSRLKTVQVFFLQDMNVRLISDLDEDRFIEAKSGDMEELIFEEHFYIRLGANKVSSIIVKYEDMEIKDIDVFSGILFFGLTPEGNAIQLNN